MKKNNLLFLFVFFISLQAIAQRGTNIIPSSNKKKFISKISNAIDLSDYIKNKSNLNTTTNTNLQENNFVVTAEHVDRVSGIYHRYLRQVINGIEVYGTESSIHQDRNGKVIMEDFSFVTNIESTLVVSATPSLTATEAINRIAQQMDYSVSALEEIERTETNNQQSKFNGAGISTSAIPAKLMYYYREGIGTVLVWEIAIEEISSSDYWNFRVNASTGTIIDKDNFTVSCISAEEHDHEHSKIGSDLKKSEEKLFYTVENNPALMAGSYNVIAMPDESPQHGSMVRTVIANPDNALASPFGWHDTNGVAGAESNYTIGNNTDAYDDRTSTSSGTGSGTNSERAFGGSNLIFSDPFNTNVTASGTDGSIDAAVTNLFYWANIIHDVTYQYGFDEASGNFQINNYGNGGVGGDSVRSEAQDGSGTCNANFSTPTDGGRGRMQMYVCGTRDGDFDNGVIIHEYGHGISTRLTGGAGNSGCLNNAEQQGEGWSDYFGLMLTMEPGDSASDSRGIGTWLVGQPANGNGIRTYPYSTNMIAVNSHTYDDIKSEAIPHGVGSVWAAMLWEMTWDLIAIYGFDPDFYTGTGGNNIAMQLVMSGLKLQPCSPGFVDSRDAILAADQALYGGANSCTIWAAFARRGLGFSATQGSSGNRSDGVEAFDLPPNTGDFAISSTEVCITSGVQNGLGGGTPIGGVYSGAGITDDGNGTSFTFDPTAAGVGPVTVNYNVADACSGGGNSDYTDTITVTSGMPDLTCQNATVTLNGSGNASVVWQDVVANGMIGGYAHTLFGGNNLETMTGSDIGLGDDAITGAIPIGFDFNFYGNTYSNIYVCSNGFVTFDSNAGMTAAQSRTPQTVPNPTLPNNIVALFWGDLDPSAGGTIKVQTFGSAPNRKFVVEFLNVRYWNQTESVSGQLKLYEGSNLVEIHFIDVDLGNQNKTMGIENSDGTQALTNSATNNSGWSLLDTAATADFTLQPDTFADNCGNSVSLSLSQSNFTCKDIGDNIVTITADDGNGGVTTCDTTVTVIGESTTWNGGWDNGAPDAGKQAVFSSNYTTSSADIDACSCDIDSGTTVTIKDGDYMKIEGDITVDSGSKLIIEHQGSLVQVDDNASVINNGTIEVKKTTPVDTHDSFSILGSPMSGTTRGGAYAANNVVMNHDTNQFFLDDEVTALDPLAVHFADEFGNNWDFMDGVDPINVTEGYLVGPTTQSVNDGDYELNYSQGTLNNGVYTYDAILHIDENNSANMLSNPYASAIKADDFMGLNSTIIDVVYFWEHLTPPSGGYPGYRSENWNMGDISLINSTGGVAAPNGGIAPTNLIPSGQGFGIKAKTAGTVTFNNSLRVTGPNEGYRNNENTDRLLLKVENPIYHLQSGALIGFTEDATDGYESNYDAKRLATPVSIYSVLEEKELGIQGRSVFNENHIIPLGFRTQVEEVQIYTIAISSIEGALISEATVYLKDNVLNTTTNLNEENYTFTSNEGNYKERFELVFTEEVLSNQDFNDNLIGVYPNPSTGIINIASPQLVLTGIAIYDIAGREVRRIAIEDQNDYQIDISTLETSMYFVKIQTQNGSITKQIIKQ